MLWLSVWGGGGARVASHWQEWHHRHPVFLRSGTRNVLRLWGYSGQYSATCHLYYESAYGIQVCRACGLGKISGVLHLHFISCEKRSSSLDLDSGLTSVDNVNGGPPRLFPALLVVLWCLGVAVHLSQWGRCLQRAQLRRRQQQPLGTRGRCGSLARGRRGSLDDVGERRVNSSQGTVLYSCM